MKLIFILTIILYTAASFAQNKIYHADPARKPVLTYEKLKYKSLSNDHFRFNQSYNENDWSREFTVPGIVGSVYTMASDGRNLYIGGSFLSAGNAAANNIVKWDGENWISIGDGLENGVNGAVHGIAFSNGKLFVGGLFNKAGSSAANGIACWDGNEWNTLGEDSTNGLRKIVLYNNDSTAVETGFAYAVYADKNKIYVGGYFHLVGTDTTNGIASWDLENETWGTFNGGLGSIYEEDPVYAYSFQAKGDELFVGGKFYSAGGVPALNIAKWNGNGWESLGNANNWVVDMDIDDEGNIYAAGMFDTVGNINASGVAKYNGTKWEALGDVDFAPGDNMPFIKQVVVENNNIYVGGTFDQLMNQPANSFARWDGTQWHIIQGLTMAFNNSFNGGITALQVLNGRMFIGGSFTKAGNHFLTNVAEWDPAASAWKKLSGGAEDKGIYDGFIHSIESGKNSIYAAGSFSVAGNVYARNIAEWKDGYWQSLGQEKENGIDGVVFTLLSDSNNVFAGGYFGHAGTTEAYHIAQWDGNKWSSIGIGVGGVDGAAVYALAKSGNYLYVGGHFSVVGDDENYALPANSFARFDLLTKRWESFGNGIELFQGFPGFVNAIEISGDQIYVGGDFTIVDGKEVHYLAQLKDTLWSESDSINIDLTGPVTALKIYNEDLIAGGMFTLDTIGNTTSFAKWNGRRWEVISGGLSSSSGSVFVEAILPFNSGFLTTGRFDFAGDELVNNIAYYNSSGWQKLGTGTNNLISDIAVIDNNIYAAGAFDVAGNYPSVSFAQFNSSATTVNQESIFNSYYLYQNFPNPFNPSTIISFSIPKTTVVNIKVFDVLGKQVALILNEVKQLGTHKVEFNAGSLSSGIYFYQLVTPEFRTTGKMILAK